MIAIDISWPITPDMTEYKDNKMTEFVRIKTFEKDNVRASKITLASHAGTHIDAPSHFLKDGKSVENVSLAKLIGPCIVLDLTHVKDAITRDVLKKFDAKIQKNSIVLLKTSNSDLGVTGAFKTDFVYLEKSGAEYLVEKEIKSVGIDYLGIERNQPKHETHCTLMEKDIVIVEGLRLQEVEPGMYLFVCLPLNVIGLDASLARAILMQDVAE